MQGRFARASGEVVRHLFAAILLVPNFGLGSGSMIPWAATSSETPRVLYDVAYGPDPKHRMDVYLPEHPERAPVLLVVHGGAWKFGDKGGRGLVDNKFAYWGSKGYIVVAINFRLCSANDTLAQANDVAKALAFAQSQASGWGGDETRFVLMGHSSGAHLAALVASAPAMAQGQGAKPWLATIALDSAGYDLVKIMEGRHLRFYDRALGRNPADWHRASPFHRLETAPQPMLLVCSSKRRVSCPQARTFADKITAVGGRVEVLPVGKSHSKVSRDLGLPGPYTEAVQSFLTSLGLP